MPKVINGIGKVFNVQEIADLLGVSEYTVLRHYRAGRLNGRKFGRSVLFLADELEQFLRGNGRAAPKKAKGERFPSKPMLNEARRKREQEQRNAIIEAMEQVGNYRKKAAEILGVSTVTLSTWFKKHDLEFPENRGREYPA